MNQIEILLKGRNDTAPMFAQVRRDMDAIAGKAKATPLTIPTEVY